MKGGSFVLGDKLIGTDLAHTQSFSAAIFTPHGKVDTNREAMMRAEFTDSQRGLRKVVKAI